MTKLKVTILSLSVVTVMAGAAVGPALGVIAAYFSDADPLMIKLIITIPSLFIIFNVVCVQRHCEQDFFQNNRGRRTAAVCNRRLRRGTRRQYLRDPGIPQHSGDRRRADYAFIHRIAGVLF